MLNKDAPTLRIAPGSISPTALHGIRLGLLFGAETIYFQDTVLALQTDEAVSRTAGDPPIHVLGVRTDWLTQDNRGTTRALRVSDDGYVEEVCFKEPLSLDIVQVLHLPIAAERPFHREISSACDRAGIEQLNPYETARRADEKSWTHRLWAARGVASPAYCVVPRHSGNERIFSLLCAFVGRLRHTDIVLQPNTGTEGVGVERFRIETSMLRQTGRTYPAVLHARSLAFSDDVLVREQRGNVRFRSGTVREEGYRNVTFRIHVVWDGRRFISESGYAQVAQDEETFAASRGRGGDVVAIGEALSNLWRRGPGGWERLILTVEEIDRIGRTAVEAVEALHVGLDRSAYLKVVGMDILLEVGRRGLIPIALEANPRPAGLAQSTDLSPALRKGEPKVSFGLFEYIRGQTRCLKGEEA